MIPIHSVSREVDLLGGPKRSFGLLVHPPDVVVLDGEENKMVGVCSEKWFGSKEPFSFGGLVCRWWFERRGGSRRFPCVVSCVGGAEFILVIAVVTDKVGDLAKSLVRYDVLERHYVKMGGDFDGGGGFMGCGGEGEW